MFELEQCSETLGDCTAKFEVILDKEYTVKEFIDAVLTKNEWGRIGIQNNETNAIFGEPKCEYDYDKLKSQLPDEYLDKVIFKVNAHGGWSMMDYIIELQTK